MHVLLVEDSAGDARLVQELLNESTDYHVTFDWHTSLATALPALHEASPDVVLLDLGLPDSQGLDTLVRARASAPHIPIVVLTGYNDHARAIEALHLGAQDYLAKSGLDNAHLSRAIRYAIERYQVNDMLRSTMLELEVRNEEMASFTYSVSHDLKEPLRTLEAFSGFLLEDYAGLLDDQGRDYLGRLSQASARLKNMIEELLTLSQLGQRPHEMVRVDVETTINDILDSNQLRLQERQARATVIDPLPAISGDHSRVEQIFANLIGNSLKFTNGKAPIVEIGCAEVRDGWTTLFVRDNGLGIAPEYHERIFGVFQRLHTLEEYEGNGAGLAIVKRAAEALGGRVWLESALGAGSTFYIRLPLWVENSLVKNSLVEAS